jgi:hypothetical protein
MSIIGELQSSLATNGGIFPPRCSTAMTSCICYGYRTWSSFWGTYPPSKRLWRHTLLPSRSWPQTWVEWRVPAWQWATSAQGLVCAGARVVFGDGSSDRCVDRFFDVVAAERKQFRHEMVGA